MKILITGCCGFIGFNISKYLLDKGFKIIGIDNLNDYYDVKIKIERLREIKKYKILNLINSIFQIINNLKSICQK